LTSDNKVTNDKFLEVEELLQALSSEMLKLKSATQHYDETNENMQKICSSIEKISATNQELTNKTKQILPLMEKNILENQKNREQLQKESDEFRYYLKLEMEKHDNAVEASLSKSHKEISEQIGKQSEEMNALGASLSKSTGEISEEIRKQSSETTTKHQRLTKKVSLLQSLLIIGLSLEAVIIILLIIF
jgi:hypothetical protein